MQGPFFKHQGDDLPQIGIVIPTYNRVRHLLKTLRHLEAQTCRDFEVIVVDDGSTDDTLAALEHYRLTASFPLRLIAQSNNGQATARNRAIQILNAPITLMIGDDTFPVPDFVQIHLQYHLDHPASHAAALGYTRWSKEGQTVTPFMHWLAVGGVQFAYGELCNGTPPDWRHFYTSNLSLKTALLRANPFNERFTGYGMEDIELGYRLATHHGLSMAFLPDAIVEHLHPTDFRKACRRQIDGGAGGYLFEELWPERRPQARRDLRWLLYALLTERRVVLPLFTVITDYVTRIMCPNPLLPRVLQAYYLVGYARAAAKARGTPPLTPALSLKSRYPKKRNPWCG